MLNDIFQQLDPVAFAIGPLSVRWYGLAYIVGIALALLVAYRVAKRWQVDLNFDKATNIAVCAMIGILCGGRLGYMLFYDFSSFIANPLHVFNISAGGMSFHGALIGVTIAGAIAAKINKISFLTLADICAIGTPLGLLLGRIANFINGELWGAPTDLPWGVVFGGAAGQIARHPSQLYEAFLEGVVLFIVLYALSRISPPKPKGTFIGLFLVLYSICRFAVEFVRLPDAHIGYLLGDWFTMGQLLSLPTFVLGVATLIYAIKTKRPQVDPKQ